MQADNRHSAGLAGSEDVRPSRRSVLSAMAVVPFMATPAIAGALTRTDDWRRLATAADLFHPGGAAAIEEARTAGYAPQHLVLILFGTEKYPTTFVFNDGKGGRNFEAQGGVSFLSGAAK